MLHTFEQCNPRKHVFSLCFDFVHLFLICSSKERSDLEIHVKVVEVLPHSAFHSEKSV